MKNRSNLSENKILGQKLVDGTFLVNEIGGYTVNIKDNNFDALRLFAAGLVFYGHAFIIAGMKEPLFLSWTHLGPLGVFIFFTISGYLVTVSWDRDPHLLRFFARRALRIFPGLTACIILSAFVLGPIFTTKSIGEYFSNMYVYGYLRNIALYISFYLPGVFEFNRVPNVVNGSLWSLPIEFFMYILIAFIGYFLRNNRWVGVLLGIGSATTVFFWANLSSTGIIVYASDLRQVFLCGTYFWLGAIYYKFNLKRFFSLSNVVLAFVIMLCLEQSPLSSMIGAWILLPLIVLGFGFSYSPLLKKLTSSGDYSYGIYIYAFPIQQSIISIWPDMSFPIYVMSSGALTLFMAILSWHFVEKPILSLRPYKSKSLLTSDENSTISIQRAAA